MKKYISLSVIACMLTINNSSSAMLLKHVLVAKNPHVRMCHTKATIFTLPEKNIFNTSDVETSQNKLGYLEDLYDRNNRIAKRLQTEINNVQITIKKLELQNSIAINHTYHQEPLNMATLQSLETQLKKDLTIYLPARLSMHNSMVKNKHAGFEDE